MEEASADPDSGYYDEQLIRSFSSLTKTTGFLNVKNLNSSVADYIYNKLIIFILEHRLTLQQREQVGLVVDIFPAVKTSNCLMFAKLEKKDLLKHLSILRGFFWIFSRASRISSRKFLLG